MSDSKYIAWMRLTYNGRRGREQMPPRAQAEWDSWGFRQAPPLTPEEHEEAKRAYLEVTQGAASEENSDQAGPEDAAPA